MKKIIVIAASIFCCVALNAQDIWVKAGYANAASKTVTTIGSVTSTSNYATNGFFVGGEYEIGINDILSVAPGAEFAFQTGTVNNGNTKLSAMGINIPVLARAGFDLGGVRVFANVGPDFYFGLTDKSVTTVGSTTITADAYDNDNPSAKRFDIGLLFGIGADLKGQYRVFVNYDLGLLNTSAINNITLKTNVLQFGIGYKF